MMSNQLLDKLTFTKSQMRRNYFFSSIKVVDVLGMLTVSLVQSGTVSYQKQATY